MLNILCAQKHKYAVSYWLLVALYDVKILQRCIVVIIDLIKNLTVFVKQTNLPSTLFIQTAAL